MKLKTQVKAGGAQIEHNETLVRDAENSVPVFEADTFFDAGERGCADGPIEELAMLMRDMEPGQTVEVRVMHASVIADLGPWSRLAGHEIVQQQGNHYLLRRG